MGKDRKTRKGNREEELDDESSTISDQAVTSKNKKGKRAKDEDVWDDATKEALVSDKDAASRTKKEKKVKTKSDDEDGKSDDESAKPKRSERKKKNFDDEEVIMANKMEKMEISKPKLKKPMGKSVFEFLNDEGMDLDDSDGDGDGDKPSERESEVEKWSEAAKKKEKKGKKEKKKTEEDEELERMLAEIETSGTRKEKAKKEAAEVDETAEDDEEKKGKKKKKKKRNDDEMMLEELEEKMATVVTEVPDDDEEEDERKEKKKKKKKKKGEMDADEANKETAEGDDADDAGTIKSAAQKKKEKKERERMKKLTQKAAQEKVKKKPDEEENIVPDEKDEEEAEDGAKKKKEKGKKKKDEKEKEEKDKKRPGKKQILLMQEALKKLKDEEEKARVEEEERAKAAEDAENLRLEKLKLEQERKDRKKLKEKEKRDRLKAEGKLLTHAQKQQRARAQAMLEALRAQGLDVPKIGEKKERTPRPGDRVRPKKSKVATTSEDEAKVDVSAEPKSEVSSESLAVSSSEGKTPRDDEQISKEEIKECWEQESNDDIKDSWDMSSSNEDDDEENAEKKRERKKQRAATKKKQLAEETSESESESEETDSDESSSESDSDDEEEQKPVSERLRERASLRIQKRREENEKNRSVAKLRSPVVCVLGHVDTGKTKILDKIRHTHVQDSEAGGITQQIGATMVPIDAIREQSKMAKRFINFETIIPGLLIIDTPGHESFSNLRSRGSSLCDIAILVVDIMHGLEPQTIESINLLKQKKTPFVVALNKIDRLYEWKPNKHKDVQDTLKSQNRNTQLEFEERVKSVVLQFAEQSLNVKLFYDNDDPRTFVSLVPTSAHSGDGMGNLMALIVELTQNMMAKQISFSEELQATVLEVKAVPGLGTTVDIILVNGRIREGDTIILAGTDGPLVTQIRSLLMPQPLKELRVKNPYQEFKEVEAAQGIKVTGKDLDKAIAGLNLLVANHPDEVELCKEDVAVELQAAMSSIKLAERGVYVQASTLGSLEALIEFLRTSKIPYSGVRIGPVVKKDVMKASIMLEHDSQYAVILAFDVKIERDAQDLADTLGVKIFAADIIYHLFDKFIDYREELRRKKRDQVKHMAVFPCKLRILPQFIFNSRDPIVIGVSVEAGVVKEGTPLCVPTKDFLDIGIVTTIELNHKSMDSARKGQEVCIKIEPNSGEAPKLYGRHFEHTDPLVSKITRQSIDVCKEYFRDDLQKTDWQLMVELKKIFQIV